VDVAGDLAPLLLLAGHHPLQQGAALLVGRAQVAQGPVVLGDVAQHHPASRSAAPAGRDIATTVGSYRWVIPLLVTTSSSGSPPDAPLLAAGAAADGVGGLGSSSPRGRPTASASGQAQQPLGRRVGVDHPAQRVEHDHRLGDGLEHQAAGHRADAEQPEPEQPPHQHQAGDDEQERCQVDPPERARRPGCRAG
jgi:hypothetical protein